jgi:hypothetical protein
MNHSIVSFATRLTSDKSRALALVASVAFALLSGCAADDASGEQVDEQEEVSVASEETEGPQPDPMQPSKEIYADRRAARVRLGIDADPDARSRGALDGALCPVTHPTSCGGVCIAALECPPHLPLEHLKDLVPSRTPSSPR